MLRRERIVFSSLFKHLNICRSVIFGILVELWRDLWVQEPNLLRSNFDHYVRISQAIFKVEGCRPLGYSRQPQFLSRSVAIDI